MGCYLTRLSPPTRLSSFIAAKSKGSVASPQASRHTTTPEFDFKIPSPHILSSNSSATLVPSVASSLSHSPTLATAMPPSAVENLATEIRTLLVVIKELQSQLKSAASQNLSDITAILSTISESSFQVRVTLKRLHHELSEIYNEQYACINEKTLQRVPLWWSTFNALPLDSQRKIARRQPENSLPMLIMAALTSLRSACERQRHLDDEALRCIKSVWETVMSDLKMRELEGQNSRGVGLQWRVFGICAEKRRLKATDRTEIVLRKRLMVSRALVESLEDLGDTED